MKIKTIQIRNFKCLGPDPITLDFSQDILILIGENNTGKSSVLQALKFFFSGKNIFPEYFFNLRCDKEHAIEIIIHFFQLSDKEKSSDVIKPNLYEFEGEKTWKLKKIYFQKSDGKMDREYYCFDGNKWKPNPGGWHTNCDDLFTNEKMQTVFVEAVKQVDEESEAGEKSAFGKIFNILIKEALQYKPEYKKLLKALEKYKSLFSGSKQIPEVVKLENEISERLSQIISARTGIVPESPPEDSILPIPKLITNDGREVNVAPAQQGHGLQRALIFTLLELLAETLSHSDKKIGTRNLLMVEEPEIYMHPQMERKIADALYDIAASGKAQVICTTHSPVFIRPLEVPSILVRLCKNKTGTIKVIQKTGDVFERAEDKKKKTLRMIMDFDPSVNELFFAKSVVFVEGYTEIVVFPKTGELLSLFNDKNKQRRREVCLINSRGRDTIPLFQEVLNFYEIPYRVVHDIEHEGPTVGVNGKILTLLGGDRSRRMYFNPNIETVLEIPKGKPKWLKAIDSIEKLHKRRKLKKKLGRYIKFIYGI